MLILGIKSKIMKRLIVFTIACLLVLPVFSQTIPQSKQQKAAVKKRGTNPHAAKYGKSDIKQSKKDMDKQLTTFQEKKHQDAVKGNKENKAVRKAM